MTMTECIQDELVKLIENIYVKGGKIDYGEVEIKFKIQSGVIVYITESVKESKLLGGGHGKK